MKYIEMAMKMCPDLSIEELLKMCPTDFGLMSMKCETFADSCLECWYRIKPFNDR